MIFSLDDNDEKEEEEEEEDAEGEFAGTIEIELSSMSSESVDCVRIGVRDRVVAILIPPDFKSLLNVSIERKKKREKKKEKKEVRKKKVTVPLPRN